MSVAPAPARAPLAPRAPRHGHARPRPLPPRLFHEHYDAHDALVPEISLARLTVHEDDVVGRGAFSECFGGVLDGARPVIVKRYLDVRGRDVSSFYVDDLESARGTRNCDGVCPFAGACGVERWLVWEDVGRTTLEDALCVEGGDGAMKTVRAALGRRGGEDDATTFRAACASLARSAASVHAFDFIHRDVKPANAVLH